MIDWGGPSSWNPSAPPPSKNGTVLHLSVSSQAGPSTFLGCVLDVGGPVHLHGGSRTMRRQVFTRIAWSMTLSLLVIEPGYPSSLGCHSIQRLPFNPVWPPVFSLIDWGAELGDPGHNMVAIQSPISYKYFVSLCDMYICLQYVYILTCIALHILFLIVLRFYCIVIIIFIS